MARTYDFSLPDAITVLESEWEALLADEDKRLRNRKAIELHTKIEKLYERLDHTPPSDIKADVECRLKDLAEDLLVRVFNLSPKVAVFDD